MKIETLKELIGSNIGEITLSVDACYPTKTGASNGKPWARQDLQCSDETGKIKVSVWNHEELAQTIKGTQIKLKSIPSKRGSGVVGIKVIENEYNGVKSVQLKVDDAGIIITQAGSVGSKSLDTGYDKKTVDAKFDAVVQERTERLANEVFSSTKPTTTDPSAKLSQYGALYKACHKVANSLGVSETSEEIQKATACFFIQGVRDGLHLQMTVKPDLENDDIPF